MGLKLGNKHRITKGLEMQEYSNIQIVTTHIALIKVSSKNKTSGFTELFIFHNGLVK